jgi:type III restriction enzyme
VLKGKKGQHDTFKDTSGETKADDDAYELIMRNKAQLLDESEPVRVIFGHSALREGWDNPNIFQICALREMGEAAERRQTHRTWSASAGQPVRRARTGSWRRPTDGRRQRVLS